jgi:Fe-S-cluster containining protein
MIELPCKECKGKCCTYPAMSKEEFNRIVDKHGLLKKAKVMDAGIMVMTHLENGDCPWLVKGSCSVYELRPKTCRDYGIVPKLPCAYLYPEQASESATNMLNNLGIPI